MDEYDDDNSKNKQLIPYNVPALILLMVRLDDDDDDVDVAHSWIGVQRNVLRFFSFLLQYVDMISIDKSPSSNIGVGGCQ